MRAQVIYNPTSGKEIFKSKMYKVVEALSAKGYEVELYPTKCEKDAIEAAKKAADKKISLLVVSGGDGTLHEVVNGLAEKENRPTILYLPSGTTNDFAKSVGIPLNLDGSLSLLDKGEVTSIDIGKIEDKYFVYVACFGVFTKVSYSTPSKLKSVFGQLAYVFNGMVDLQKLNEPLDIEINANGEIKNLKASIFLVANSTGVAGLKNILPSAKLDDGKFDVINLNSKNIGILPEVIKNVTMGVKADFNKNGLLHFEAEEIAVSSKKMLKWNLDGEFGIVGDVKIKCLRQHIDIIIPKSNKIVSK
ncbi:MAG: YegS/Rv2252/BmrU family lipid kinase [Bacilli bacterium]